MHTKLGHNLDILRRRRIPILAPRLAPWETRTDWRQHGRRCPVSAAAGFGVLAAGGAVRALVGGEDAGEDAGHKGAEAGEAGADYADVGFDGRPGGGGGVVVGGVVGVGDGD